MREVGSLRAADYSRWYGYALEERHAPWKVLLPVSSETSVLAIGIGRNHLASLARSYKSLYVHKCLDEDIKWAEDDGCSFGLQYRFVEMKELRPECMGYCAIVVGPNSSSSYDPRFILRMLEPSGVALWVGPRNRVPSNGDLLNCGYEEIHRYLLLPPITCKVMLPLQDKSSFESGLELFKPFKWYNRFALCMVRMATFRSIERVGRIPQTIIGRKFGGSTNGSYLLEWLGERLGRHIADTAIYSGYTKLVLQLLSETGDVIGIAKVADMDLGRKSIERESMVLRRLAEIDELSDSVPAVLATSQIEVYTIQVQTVPGAGSKKYTNRLTHSHISFLKRLSHVDRCEMFLEDWTGWAQICRWANESECASPIDAESIRSTLEHIAGILGKIKIPFHRIHGDFAPRHALLSEKGITVVDWEDSAPHGLPLYDAVHFFLKQRIDQEHRILRIPEMLDWPRTNPNIVGICNSFKDSVPLVKDIAKLAIICAYRILMCPRLRCQEWS